MKHMLLTILLVILSEACKADMQKSNLTWYSTVKKHDDFISLTHRGSQKINLSKNNKPDQYLAAKMNLGDECYELYAKSLSECIDCPTIKINGITMTKKYIQINVLKETYLSYELLEEPNQKTISTEYDLVIYWKS
ncbi:hypothetical protein ACET64_17865 [Aeromonas veronii]|uniref:hypothetical protein n=1 Tax=Aeromonas TaxID=642 RepID=UPI0038DB8F6D